MQLPELITNSPQEYEALALTLATTPEFLAGVRDKLARNRTTTPVFDTQRFCRHLESAYVGMWERSEHGEAPESFAVPPLP
jgi:protein O-GlcNAc transferase